MQLDETNNPAEQEQQLEGSEGTLQTSEPSGVKYTLDDMKAKGDVESLWKAAKGKEAIIARHRDTPAPPAPQVVTPPTNALTRDDLVRINTKTAKGLVDAPVQENWDALIDYLPPKYRSAETPDEIAKGMTVAYTAWQQDNPENPGNPAAALQTTPAVKRTSAKPLETGERSTTPILPKSTGMADWYKKPQS